MRCPPSSWRKSNEENRERLRGRVSQQEVSALLTELLKDCLAQEKADCPEARDRKHPVLGLKHSAGRAA
jgi:hypothetical protein